MDATSRLKSGILPDPYPHIQGILTLPLKNNCLSFNVKEIREYAFSGSLRRKTQLDYLHEANATYIGLNILDRVTATRIYDGSGNLVAKSSTVYDYYALSPAANAIRHDAAYGPTFVYRGLPSVVRRWYNLASDLSVFSILQYDECGNAVATVDTMFPGRLQSRKSKTL